MFSTAVTSFSFNPSDVNFLECVSMKNQECKTRSEIINANNNEFIFYPHSIKINKCSGSCNNTNDPYGKICVSGIVKIWNPRNCECEFDKSCDIGEYLDYI